MAGANYKPPFSLNRMNRWQTISPAALHECVLTERRSRQVLAQALPHVHSRPLRQRLEQLQEDLGQKIDRLRATLTGLGVATVASAEQDDPVAAPDLPQDVRRLFSLVADWQRELWASYSEWQHDSKGEVDREAFADLRRRSDAIRRECLDIAMLI
jgi:hypothetical protein